jgi:GDSL-like lipase/acylhydrolase family protein
MKPGTTPRTTRTTRTTPRSARLFAVLLTSALLAACASSETGDDTGTGGSSATGGTNGTGGQTGTGGEHSTGGNPGSGGSGTGGLTGTGGSGTGGAAGTKGTGGSGTGGNGAGGLTGTGGSGTGGVAGAKGTGGMAGSKGTGGVAGGNGTGGMAGAKGTGGAAGGSSGSYNPCPTNGDPCKVLPLGDSITYGLITVAADKASSDPSVDGKDSHGGYRVKLFSDAVAGAKKMTFVGSQMNGPTAVASMPFPKSHEGWSGYTIVQIQGKAANDVAAAPHIILVHAGTNDTYGSDPSGAPARLSTLVDYLTTNFPNALVVIAKIIPYPSQTSNTNLINQSVAAMVQSKVTAGKHVIVADLNTGFTTSSMLAGDGIHPNQKGYDWMGDTWYSAISGYLP